MCHRRLGAFMNEFCCSRPLKLANDDIQVAALLTSVFMNLGKNTCSTSSTGLKSNKFLEVTHGGLGLHWNTLSPDHIIEFLKVRPRSLLVHLCYPGYDIWVHYTHKIVGTDNVI